MVPPARCNTSAPLFPECIVNAYQFEGTPWTNSSSYERFNPARLVANWATPQMTIHSDLDYRLPISEGLAVFNIMQELGIPSMFLNFPDENHWYAPPFPCLTFPWGGKSE